MKTIVFFGDSITEFGLHNNGYINLLNKNLQKHSSEHQYTIFGSGWRGNKVSNLLQRVDKDVIAHSPDIVFIYIGINDVWHYSPDKNEARENIFKEQYQKLIDSIKNTNDTKIILCTLSLIGEKKDETNLYDANLDRYSFIIKSLALANQLTLIDLRKEFLSYLNKYNRSNLPEGILTTDGVHLNATGNQLVADVFYDMLISL